MYLQSFEERPAATGQERRRFPRVKPDDLGRFKLEELNLRGNESAGRVSRSPWLIALGGAIVGAIINTMVLSHGSDGPAREPVEARAASPSSSKAERKSANRREEKPATMAGRPPPQLPQKALLPKPVAAQPTQPPPVGEALPDATLSPGGSIALADAIGSRQPAQRVAITGPRIAPRNVSIVPIDRDGAMVPMAGPEADDPGLEVMH